VNTDEHDKMDLLLKDWPQTLSDWIRLLYGINITQSYFGVASVFVLFMERPEYSLLQSVSHFRSIWPLLPHEYHDTLIPYNDADSVVVTTKGFVNVWFILHGAALTPHIIILQDGW